jgi:hypothetical protein
MQLVTEIRVTVELRDMGVHIRQANLGVGDDRVEVAHQIVLRHHRQLPQVIGVERRLLDVSEPIAVPGGPLRRRPHQLTQSRRSLGVQLLGGPSHPLEMLADLGQQMFDVTLARRLVSLHSTAPYWAPPAVNARHMPRVRAQ